MNDKSLRVLEYQKVISKLEACASSAPGKVICHALLPLNDLSQIISMHKENADALRRVSAKGKITFSGLKDLRTDIRLLTIGSSLGISQLLDIARLLEEAGKAKEYGKSDIDPTDSNVINDENDIKDTNDDNDIKDINDDNDIRDINDDNDIRDINDDNDKNDENGEDSLSALFKNIVPLTSLKAEINRCLLSEDEVADDASPELKRIRRQIGLSMEKMRSQLGEIINGPKRVYLQDALVTQRDGRYCVPVKAEYRLNIPGVIHGQSSSGSTLFIEPIAVVKTNNDISALESAEQAEINRILEYLSSWAARESDSLLEDISLLSRLDFIFARTYLALQMNATSPDYNENGVIDIRKARHPLIDKNKVVPVDIRVGEDFDLLVISGPNTGGKTVSLKTAGLLTLMGQAGLYIPASEHSRLSIFTDVFADIGDEQSIEQSLSTFSGHMTNIVSFWNKADEKSLILFDELGAGTDPEEGAALAISILSSLHERRIRTIATTHYSELKIYALCTNGVENACCEFDVATLQPTYRLLIGVPGKSNAFAISKKLGLPDELIENAKKYITQEEEDFEDVIGDLENKRSEMEKTENELKKEREQIALLKIDLETRTKRLQQSSDKILKDAREKALQLLRETKQYADETIRAYNKLGSTQGSVRQMEKERSAIRDKIKKLNFNSSDESKNPKEVQAGPRHRKADPKKLRKGDAVFVKSMNMKGVVTSLPDARGNLSVRMGILHSQVNVRDLEVFDKVTINAQETIRTSPGAISIEKASSIPLEINLIGKTTDEAIMELDKYLDDAVISHLPSVRIIHGKGTGALRKAVHDYLRKQRRVSSFRLGEYGEGDAGVTIVKLK